MIRRAIRNFFVLLVAVFLCLSHSYAIAKSWQVIQEESRNAVVFVDVVKRDFNWFNPYLTGNPTKYAGTGFFIDQNGSIITCAHVIKDAVSVFIVMPSLGKQCLKARVVGLCPEQDIALLHLEEDSLTIVRKKFGEIPQLFLSDSDAVKRGEEVIAFGYPGATIETHQLKGAAGVISARLNCRFQTDVAINPGNSGGPMVDRNGNVIGIVSSGRIDAQNINFAIPINTAKHLLLSLYENKLLRIQSLGIAWSYTTQEMRRYLDASDREGCMVCDVFDDKIGFQIYDLIIKVNGFAVDNYGEIKTLADGDAIQFQHYIQQLPLGETVDFDLYRNGQPITISMVVDRGMEKPIPTKYPAYEKIDYEVFAGMIIMPLTANYIEKTEKSRPSLQRYLNSFYAQKPRLVIADIIPDSQLAQGRTMSYGDTINEINGEKVCTLDDFRRALQKSIKTGIVTIKTTHETRLVSDNIFNVLSLSDSCKETVLLSQVHGYPVSETVKKLIEKMD